MDENTVHNTNDTIESISLHHISSITYGIAMHSKTQMNEIISLFPKIEIGCRDFKTNISEHYRVNLK